MSFLFSEPGLRHLDEIVGQGLLCGFDFDGTLAPIVTHPVEAHLPPQVRERLVELSTYVPVAILTGRALDDIKTRLGFEPDYLVGNHGLEGVPGWEQRNENHEALCRHWKGTIVAALGNRNMFDPAIQLEDKRYSLSVHYRLARDYARAEKELAMLFGDLQPHPRVIAGKCVFNLLPQGGADKGSALEQLMRVSGARNAMYVGDDMTDEDVFRLRRRDVLTIRVEHATDSAAQYFVHRHDDMMHLFDELIRRLKTRRSTRLIPPESASNL